MWCMEGASCFQISPLMRVRLYHYCPARFSRTFSTVSTNSISFQTIFAASSSSESFGQNHFELARQIFTSGLKGAEIIASLFSPVHSTFRLRCALHRPENECLSPFSSESFSRFKKITASTDHRDCTTMRIVAASGKHSHCFIGNVLVILRGDRTSQNDEWRSTQQNIDVTTSLPGESHLPEPAALKGIQQKLHARMSRHSILNFMPTLYDAIWLLEM
jgi:hypothetical protein